MILNRARHNLSSRCRQPVYQYYQRIIPVPIPVLRHIPLLSRSSAMMRNDQLPLLQELIGYSNSFAQQAAWIAAQIKNQPLQIAELVESLADFFLRGLVKSSNVQISNPRAD